ncbi:MAG TPA: HD domain-containing phosphohydrolase [Thermoleophilaceae bacterium]|nr:HD domain-containing phosphohydrolase [Thermoleophilaceae bacterium]
MSRSTNSTKPAKPRARLGAVRGLYVVAVVGYAALSLSGASQSWLPPSSGHWIAGSLLAIAGLLCAARALRIPGNRPAFLMLAAGLLSWAGGEVIFAAAPSLATGPLSTPNLMSLAFYPLAVVAAMSLMRARLDGFFTTLWLDGLAGALSVCAIVASFLFPPVLAHLSGPTIDVVGALSYPLADLLLVASGLFTMAMTGWRPGRVLASVTIASGLVAVTDSFSLWWAATGHTGAEPRLQWLWTVAALILVETAWRPVPVTPPIKDASLRLLLFPVAVSLTALGLLLSGLVHSLELAGYELAVSALVLIVVRLALTVLENIQMAEGSKREALTDALTGLGNRRRLMADVEDALVREGTTVLVLFDLDGFKGYNDSFGHPAGDALLARLGGALDKSVREVGSAYRLGGDEFCALLRVPTGELPARIDAAVAALSERGQGFSVAPSYGSIVIPTEATDVSAAFQLADQRLYSQKGDRRRAREGEQVRDALIQALRERRPDLDEHLGGVARLAHAVARRLAMSATEVDEVTRAAELHDIGKMAVPDAILEKPAGLDDGELELIRQHTIIGERILAVSPALRQVGLLVRHSHERYDGQGYPDGLVGDDIPLGARIIAACDAFDAMTTDRPYQPAISVRDALSELRACAGGQFDPKVIEAFCTEAESLLEDDEAGVEVFEEAWTLSPPDPADLFADGIEAVDQGQH